MVTIKLQHYFLIEKFTTFEGLCIKFSKMCTERIFFNQFS